MVEQLIIAYFLSLFHKGSRGNCCEQRREAKNQGPPNYLSRYICLDEELVPWCEALQSRRGRIYWSQIVEDLDLCQLKV